MKKIPTLFKREFHNRNVVAIFPELSDPSLACILNGEGIATEKIDGSCCAIIDGTFYKRYDAKQGKTPPENAIPCDEPDPVTGHWPHWVPVKSVVSGDKWYLAARKNTSGPLEDGTYEAIGPHFQGNPYGLEEDVLVKHGNKVIDLPDRSYDGIQKYLRDHVIEGIVFWKDGKPLCKIKRRDFGFKWPADKNSTNYYDHKEPDSYIKLPMDFLCPEYDSETLKNPVSQIASGDGMIYAGINDGDVLVVIKDLPPVNGDIVTATVNGELMCRRFFIQDDKAHFRREDGLSPDIITDDYHIHGVVIEILKKVHRFISQAYDPNSRIMLEPNKNYCHTATGLAKMEK